MVYCLTISLPKLTPCPTYVLPYSSQLNTVGQAPNYCDTWESLSFISTSLSSSECFLFPLLPFSFLFSTPPFISLLLSSLHYLLHMLNPKDHFKEILLSVSKSNISLASPLVQHFLHDGIEETIVCLPYLFVGFPHWTGPTSCFPVTRQRLKTYR